MSCHVMRDADGKAIGFVCGVRMRRKRCGACATGDGEYQCDWKLTGDKAGKTCDAYLCVRCAHSPAPDKHLCPAHWRLWEHHPANTGG